MTRLEERGPAGRVAAASDVRLAEVAGRSTAEPQIASDDADRPGVVLDDAVETVVAVFRLHPHVGNVINHICGGRWENVAQALRTVFEPHLRFQDLSPLAENVLELLWAERGITGRILKPCFCDLLNKLLSPPRASLLFGHLAGLLLEMRAHRYAPPALRADDAPGGKAPATDGGPQ